MELPSLPMTAFNMSFTDGCITLAIDEVWGYPNETAWPSGYGAKGTLTISAENYQYRGTLYFTTGELYEFYEEMKDIYKRLQGFAQLNNHEHAMFLKITVDHRGQVECRGWSRENPISDNKLQFTMHGDQTYLPPVLKDLDHIYSCFGGKEGIINK
jgi:hypothetical protein